MEDSCFGGRGFEPQPNHFYIDFILFLLMDSVNRIILEINKNATLVFSICFQHWLVHEHFVFIGQLYFTYYIKRSPFLLIDCQYALLKSTWSKTSYPTPCNVPHEWFLFLHRALFADWGDYIFPTSKCRYVFSISIYSKIKY